MDPFNPDLNPGARVGRYTVRRAEALPEIEATFYELEHELGSRHVHVSRADDNLTFGVMFPTVPQDSTGVAHILEHLVLMGSRSFPVRDPFFTMLPRTLSTFMNAFTTPDWTMYPFSTRNTQDFRNILRVYLDAAFFPLLRPELFKQEAWRLEPDAAGTLKLHGVVYNEMKGAMANASSVMFQAQSRALYPDLTYANNYGGEPANIPDLTYEALKDFHSRHYHPSNAYFYTYGNMPLREVLGEIEDRVMSHFEPLAFDVRVPDQARFEAPRRAEATYPSTDVELGAQVLVSWMVSPSSSSYDVLRWSLLSDVLLGSAAAPLRRALIESGVGSATAAGTGYNDSFREASFGAGLRGLKAERADEVERLVLDTLTRIADEGIEEELVDSAIHQLELARREVSNAGGYPYSLKLFFRFAVPWLHGGDPLRALQLDEDLERLQRERQTGGFFERMIREELLDNPHRATVVLRPDPELAARQEQEEHERVARLSVGFGPEDVERLRQEAALLEALQGEEQDLSVLPTLSLEDVPREVPRPEYDVQDEGGVTVARAAQPTSGVVYVDVQLNAAHLDPELLELLPLYAYAVTKSGAGGLDYVGLSRRIEAKTGGISASSGVGTGPSDLEDVRASFSLSGKALARNAGDLVELLRDVLADPAFDVERLRQLLRQQRTGLESSVVSSGHAYARGLAAAQLSPAAALSERQGGLAYLAMLKKLVDEDRVGWLIERFGVIQRELLRGRARVLLTATDDDLSADLGAVTGLLGAGVPVQAPPSQPLPRAALARTTDVPVNYNAKVFRTVPYVNPDAPVLLALAQLLKSEYVHPQVREKGGAYGGYAAYDAQGGLFSLMSYRDPHVARTYEVFQGARSFLHEAPLGERELREAVLSATKQLDPLTSPDTVARMRFFGDMAGYTPEVQEAFRERLLTVTLDDMRRVYDTYVVESAAAYAMVTGKDPNAELAGMGLEFEVARI